MKKIKNYTVKAESIKKATAGLYDYMKYLTDMEHKNHKGKTTGIKTIIGNTAEFFKRTKSAASKAEMIKIKNRKGGKPSNNFAISFTLNYPPTMKPKELQHREILLGVYKDLAEFLSVPPREPKKRPNTSDEVFANTLKRYKTDLDKFEPVSFEEFRDMSLSVLHEQDNPHIHLTLPMFRNGRSFQALKSPAFLNALKASFTIHADRVMNKDINNYQVSSEYKKGYTRASSATDKAEAEKMISMLSDSLKTLLRAYPDDKLLNMALQDLEAGKTIKARKKLEKFQSHHKTPS